MASSFFFVVTETKTCFHFVIATVKHASRQRIFWNCLCNFDGLIEIDGFPLASESTAHWPPPFVRSGSTNQNGARSDGPARGAGGATSDVKVTAALAVASYANERARKRACLCKLAAGGRGGEADGAALKDDFWSNSLRFHEICSFSGFGQILPSFTGFCVQVFTVFFFFSFLFFLTFKVTELRLVPQIAFLSNLRRKKRSK